MSNQIEKDLHKFYVNYRAYVSLYTPIMAETEEEAYELARKLPNDPTKDMELILASNDLDFELDIDYIYDSINFSKVDKVLEKKLIANAVNQGVERAKLQREQSIKNINAQIENANAQLLTATKSVTETIDKLKLQLEELEKGN